MSLASDRCIVEHKQFVIYVPEKIDSTFFRDIEWIM